MQLADKDGDGHISYDEFVAVADGDGDGNVSHSEFFKAMGSLARQRLLAGESSLSRYKDEHQNSAPSFARVTLRKVAGAKLGFNIKKNEGVEGGVVVTEVKRGSISEGVLQVGDIVSHINGVDVKDGKMKEAKNAIKDNDELQFTLTHGPTAKAVSKLATVAAAAAGPSDEKRWKALKQQEAVNRGEKFAAAPSVTPAKEDKLDTLIRDANRMIGGDADNEVKIRGFFSKIDTDDDQRVSKKELEAKWDEMKPWFVVALAKEPKLLGALDQNSDGDFTLEEFWAFANEATKDHSPDWITSIEFVRALGLCGRRHQVAALLRMPFAGTGQEKVLVTESDHKKLVNVSATLLSHFDDIDSNQDQNLSRDELHHHVFSKKDGKAYNEIQAYMQMVDKDGDGHVSLDEFMAEADSDSNGVITHIEFFRALKNFAAAKMKSGRTGSAISVPVETALATTAKPPSATVEVVLTKVASKKLGFNLKKNDGGDGGIMISNVTTGSLSEGKLRVGDIVSHVNGIDVKDGNLKEAKKAIKDNRSEVKFTLFAGPTTEAAQAVASLSSQFASLLDSSGTGETSEPDSEPEDSDDGEDLDAKAVSRPPSRGKTPSVEEDGSWGIGIVKTVNVENSPTRAVRGTPTFLDNHDDNHLERRGNATASSIRRMFSGAEIGGVSIQEEEERNRKASHFLQDASSTDVQASEFHDALEGVKSEA